ncbi:hypothetical protein [Delftia acidovorans]|uniref:hypothetical protein n=1 Tax=Delftia acidovorans TaxID=80866 RepID=UPI0028EC9E77|nr:hypothetical protein [Delftia acidovorans]
MTTAQTPSRADALIREHRASMHPETLRAWASDAVDELGRLQAENERLQGSLEAQRLISDRAIALAKELEARKPLPMSIERLDELWAAQRSFHGGEPLKMGHVEFARLIEVEYGVLGRIPMREENGGQIAPALVDKSPNLQEPLVDKTSDLQDRPAPLSDDEIIAAQEALALSRSRIGLPCTRCETGKYRADRNAYHDFHRCDSCMHVPMWGDDGKELGPPTCTGESS